MNLQALAVGHDAHLSWQQPNFDPTSESLLGYNVYRDGLKLNVAAINSLVYVDYALQPGEYNYCIKALYNLGESAGDCQLLDVAVPVPMVYGDPQLTIYPNPAKDLVTIKSNCHISEISLCDYSGNQVYLKMGNNTVETIHVSAFPAGLYLLRVTTNIGTVNKKLVIE